MEMLFINPPLQLKDIDYVSIELRGDSAVLFYHQIMENRDYSTALPYSELKDIIDPTIDSSIVLMYEQKFKPHTYTYNGVERFRIHEFTSLMNMRQNLASYKLTEIFNRMMWDREIRNGLNSRAIMIDYLDSLINNCLNDNGLSLEFGFMIAKDEETYIKHRFDSELTQDQQYYTPLFSLPGYPGNINLHIILHKENRYIFESIFIMILVSALFTLFLLITFIYSIRSISTQKKIADYKSDFLKRMSHDFKTPIATMGLAIDSLTSNQSINKPDQIKLFGGILKEEISRLHGLLERILAASMLQKGDVEVNLKKTNINQLLAVTIQNLELLVSDKQGVLQFKAFSQDLYLHIDSSLFNHIIYNLVDNGIKYNKKEPIISVELRTEQGQAILTVKDNGIGIPIQEQKRIFDKLYRIEYEELSNIEGNGLGLYFVKKSVELMNGSIKVKSEIDQGSEFIISFPLI
jgi:two-component system phosphate regulon sensor histidine kinase PhoR